MKKGFLSGVPSTGKRILALLIAACIGFLVGYILCIKGYMDFSENMGRVLIFSHSIPVVGFIISILIGIGFAFLGFFVPKLFLVLVVIIAGFFSFLISVANKSNSNSSSSSSNATSNTKSEEEEVYIVNAYVVNTSSNTRYAYAQLSDGSTKSIYSGNNDLRVVNWTTKTVTLADWVTDSPTSPVKAKVWHIGDLGVKEIR